MKNFWNFSIKKKSACTRLDNVFLQQGRTLEWLLSQASPEQRSPAHQYSRVGPMIDTSALQVDKSSHKVRRPVCASRPPCRPVARLPALLLLLLLASLDELQVRSPGQRLSRPAAAEGHRGAPAQRAHGAGEEAPAHCQRRPLPACAPARRAGT